MKNLAISFVITALLILTIYGLSNHTNINNKSISEQKFSFESDLSPLPIDSDMIKGKLPNGMTYYIRHIGMEKGKVSFCLVNNVGAILEDDSQNGLVHFTEHMCLNGTKNLPKNQIISYFESKGLLFGSQVNASTFTDKTIYCFNRVPVTQNTVDTALLALHDISHFATIDQEEVDKERGVILEEWRMRNSGNMRFYDEERKCTLKGTKYAKRNVLGDTSIIKHCGQKDIRAFYDKWYRPDLQALIVVGDINPKEIEVNIRKTFADIPKPLAPIKRTRYQIPDNLKPIVGIITDPEMPYYKIILSYRFDSEPAKVMQTKKGFNQTVVRNLIIIAINNRFKDIIEEPNTPFYKLDACLHSLTPTKKELRITCMPIFTKENEARKKILREIEKIYRYGFTMDELNKTSPYFTKPHTIAYSESRNSIIDSYIYDFLDSIMVMNAYKKEKLKVKLIQKLNNREVNKYIRKVLNNNIVLTLMGPENKDYNYPTKNILLSELSSMKYMKIEENNNVKLNKNENKEIQIKENIVPGEIVSILKNKELGYTEYVLSNGIKFVYKPIKNGSFLKFKAWSKGGSSLIQKNDLVAANMAIRLKTAQGLGNLSKKEIDEKAIKLCSCTPFLAAFQEGLNGESSKHDFVPIMKKIYLSFQEPKVDNGMYNNSYNRFLTEKKYSILNPQVRFNDSLKLIRYSNNPRICTTNRILASKRISNNKILSIYKDRFANPADFIFLFVGSVKKDSILKYAKIYLGSLKTTDKYENSRDNDTRLVEGNVEKQIKENLLIPMTKNALLYHIPCEYNLKNKIIAQYLQEILTLRYHSTIREEQGGSYYVNVNLEMKKDPKKQIELEIIFNSNPKVNKKLLKISQAELEKIASYGPLKQEFVKAQKNIIYQFRENKECDDWWLDVIYNYYECGYNLMNSEQIINSINPKDITNLAHEIIKSGNKIQVSMVPEKQICEIK